MVWFILNDRRVSVDADANTPLLWVMVLTIQFDGRARHSECNAKNTRGFWIEAKPI